MSSAPRSPAGTGIDSAAVLALTLAAHVAADGHLPSWGFVFALGPLTAALCWAARSRRVRAHEAAGLLVVLQLGVHLGLEAAAPSAHAAHTVGVSLFGSHLSGTMLVAHLLSGLAATVLLSARRGLVDRAVALLTWFVGQVHGAPAAPSVAVGAPLPGSTPASRLLPQAPRRGPPVALCGV